MAEEKTCVVTLIRNHDIYNARERAAFPLAHAKNLIKKGYAVLSDKDVTMAALGLTEQGKETDEPDMDAISTVTHEHNAEQCYELISSIGTLEELQAIWDGEKNHPNHEGGRKGVLQAMQARAQELKDELEDEQEEPEG